MEFDMNCTRFDKEMIQTGAAPACHNRIIGRF